MIQVKTHLNEAEYKRFRRLAVKLGNLTNYALVKKAVKEFMENTNASTKGFLWLIYCLTISALILAF